MEIEIAGTAGSRRDDVVLGPQRALCGASQPLLATGSTSTTPVTRRRAGCKEGRAGALDVDTLTLL
ncbi:MAG: hypothetical protein ACRYHA_24745, partial [Janthinobacterium lividum]